MDTGLRTAIYNRALTITGMDADHVWPVKIPEEDTAGDVITFDEDYLSIKELTQTSDFRSFTEQFENSYVQFRTWGKLISSLETLTKNLRTIFDDSEGNYTIANYRVKTVEFQFSRDIPGEGEDVIGILTQYKFLLEKI